MFEAGWIKEVLRLRETVYPLSREAGMALGYREIGEYLDGRRTLTGTIAEVRLRTRQFAKRQLTWFRALPGSELADRKLTFERWVRTMATGYARP
jgi:tRNA dimethylallyltransferase